MSLHRVMFYFQRQGGMRLGCFYSQGCWSQVLALLLAICDPGEISQSVPQFVHLWGEDNHSLPLPGLLLTEHEASEQLGGRVTPRQFPSQSQVGLLLLSPCPHFDLHVQIQWCCLFFPSLPSFWHIWAVIGQWGARSSKSHNSELGKRFLFTRWGKWHFSIAEMFCGDTFWVVLMSEQWVMLLKLKLHLSGLCMGHRSLSSLSQRYTVRWGLLCPR